MVTIYNGYKDSETGELKFRRIVLDEMLFTKSKEYITKKFGNNAIEKALLYIKYSEDLEIKVDVDRFVYGECSFELTAENINEFIANYEQFKVSMVDEHCYGSKKLWNVTIGGK